MAAAAQAFLAALSDGQRAKATFELASEGRDDWHFIPKDTRPGLQLKEMDPAQRHLAYALLGSGLGNDGICQDDDRDEPGADFARIGKCARPPRPGEVLFQHFRETGGGRHVGLAVRRAPLFGEFHRGGRPDVGHAEFSRRESR